MSEKNLPQLFFSPQSYISIFFRIEPATSWVEDLVYSIQTVALLHSANPGPAIAFEV
jgi:hypothetical protein